ncbi:winged helix-turn-helix transcriptional regulator [Kineococcus sp. SYSU DK006]|uniref:winged helix-turn-helix transcriptional regulator n=1 Tax=Kineococcus sp. SYSU DK006 TaxID=3383127 RepID=UPI003D7E4D22
MSAAPQERPPAHLDVRGDYQGEDPCSLANALKVVGERWTFFVLREALAGTTRFSDFRSTLGIAPDVLSARLSTLVEAGVMTRQTYREPGQRARDAYHLTASGRQLGLALAALQQWGDAHTPSRAPATTAYRSDDGRPVSAGFVDDRGRPLPAERVHVERTAAHPAT